MSVVVLFVVLVGTSDTLAAIVFARRRAIGTMRAIGAAPGGIGGMIAAQALAIGFVGGGVGLVTGVLAARSFVDGIFRTALGWHVPFRFEPTTLAICFVIGLTACLAGAVVPAIRAARLTATAALSYE